MPVQGGSRINKITEKIQVSVEKRHLDQIYRQGFMALQRKQSIMQVQLFCALFCVWDKSFPMF